MPAPTRSDPAWSGRGSRADHSSGRCPSASNSASTPSPASGTDPATALDCVRALPVEALLTEADSVNQPAYGGPGAVLPRSPIGAIADGAIHPVPVLSGFNSDEPLLLFNNALTAGLPR